MAGIDSAPFGTLILWGLSTTLKQGGNPGIDAGPTGLNESSWG